MDSILLWLDSATAMEQSNPMLAARLSNMAIEESIVRGDRLLEAKACFTLAEIQAHQGFLSIAETNYQKSIQIAKDKYNYYHSAGHAAEIESALFRACWQLAICQEQLNKLAEAGATAAECLGPGFGGIPAAEKRKVTLLLARIRSKQGQTDVSLNLLDDVLKQEQAGKNVKGESTVHLEMGRVYRMKGDAGKAEASFSLAKKLADHNGLHDISNMVNDELAALYRDKGDAERELKMRNDNLALNLRVGDMNAVANQNFQIGNLFLSNNNATAAEHYFNEMGLGNMFPIANPGSSKGDTSSFAVHNSVSLKPLRSAEMQAGADALRKMAESYASEKNMKKALEYYVRFAHLQDSIEVVRVKELEAAIALSSSMGQSQERIQMLEKERELSGKSIEQLRQDKQSKVQQLVNRNMVIGSLTVVLLVLLVAGFFLIRSTNARRKADKLLALQSLSGQMNPHFIFNALNSVNEYISQNDERAANRYLSSFSKLMRQVMDASRHTFIPLQEELEMLQVYLQLEQARFREQFEYSFEVSPELRNSEFELPPMIVQPYLENAVWHGLRYRETKGHLWVSFVLAGEDLQITIRDNGIGVKKSKEIKTRSQKKQNSLGMRNIGTRVALLNEIYQSGIRIDVSETEPQAENAGVTVNIHIPGKHKPAVQ